MKEEKNTQLINNFSHLDNFVLKKEFFDEFIKKCEDALKLKKVKRNIGKPDINPNDLKVSKEILSCKFKNIVTTF
jgi:hypothetical protein